MMRESFSIMRLMMRESFSVMLLNNQVKSFLDISDVTKKVRYGRKTEKLSFDKSWGTYSLWAVDSYISGILLVNFSFLGVLTLLDLICDNNADYSLDLLMKIDVNNFFHLAWVFLLLSSWLWNIVLVLQLLSLRK